MSAAIIGLGTAVPHRSMTQVEAAEGCRALCCDNDRQARVLRTVFDRSEIRTRSSVILEQPPGAPAAQSFYPPSSAPGDRGPTTRVRMARYAENAPQLAAEAARRALHESALAPDEITHLVTVSCTGFFAPGVEIALIRDLQLLPTTLRTHVGFMGCHGAINGLRVAAAFAEADPNARVLLCAVELCSLHFRYGWDPDAARSNALFADGAAAAVLRSDEAALNGQAIFRLHASGSCVFPASEEVMTWTIGDHGFEMTLSSRVPDLIATHLHAWMESWLGARGLKLHDIASWAIHPGGPRIVTSALESLGLPDDAATFSREILAEFGNMSSPTVLFILDRMRRAHAGRPCVALGFGPGLAAEAALLL